MNELQNFKNNPAFMKLLKTFDCEVTNIFRDGVRVSEPERERLTMDLMESFKTNRPDISKTPELSYFKRPVTNVQPYAKVTLPRIYKAITGQYFKAVTKKLRAIKDKDQVRKFKAASFDYVTFSGTFSKRNNNNLIGHSSYLCFDLDNLVNLESVRDALKHDEYTELLFQSPGGRGLKWICQVDIKRGSHLDYFNGIASYLQDNYKVTADPSGKDCSRACFICHDPDAYLSPKLRGYV